MKLHLTGLAALTVAVASGCYTTTIRSGTVASPASVAFDHRWHHGVLWGMGEISGPYDLSQICPHGWSEIETETSFVNGIVDLISSGVYAPQTITVRCSLTPAAPLAAQPVPQPASAPPVASPVPPTAAPAIPPAASEATSSSTAPAQAEAP